MTCKLKHTTCQPKNTEFNCPKCGAKVGDFYIYESAADESPESEECTLLHPQDVCHCYGCSSIFSGVQVAAAVAKRRASKGLVSKKCPHCKGSGVIVTKKKVKA